MKKTLKTILCVTVILIATQCQKSSPPITSNEASTESAYDFRTDAKLKQFLLEISNTNVSLNSNERTYSGVDMQKINAIYNIRENKARRTAYLMLNETEKFAFWDNLTTIKIEASNLSSTQKDLLFDVQRTYVTSAIINTQNEDYKSILKTVYLPALTQQLIAQGISNNGQVNIFSTGLIDDNLPMFAGQVTGGRGCTCNEGSSITCTGSGGGHCEKGSGCGTSDFGCGFLFIFKCNGECAHHNPFSGAIDWWS